MLSRKDFWWLLKTAGMGSGKHRILNLSSSLAFYTIFSVGPMLLVVIFVSDLFWGRQAIEGTIYHQIKKFVGDGAALQVQEIIKNSSINGSSIIAFVGFLTLIIAATTLFSEIQSSLNVIWNIKVKKGRPWLIILKGRLLSFSLVAGLGFLLLVSLIVNGLLEGFGRHMDKQAEELKADLAGATVERIGEGIKITFDSGLMFAFDSYNLSPSTTSNLSSLATTLNKYDDTEILIEGHTDKKGSEEYNMELSKKRSESVASYLEALSVKSSRITTQGYGELQPVSEIDEENRRVEVAIFANKKMKKAADRGEL